MHAHRHHAETGERPTVEPGQHRAVRFGADIEFLAPPAVAAGIGQAPGDCRQRRRIGQRHAVRVCDDLRERRQPGGEVGLHPPDLCRTDAERAAARLAAPRCCRREHGVDSRLPLSRLSNRRSPCHMPGMRPTASARGGVPQSATSVAPRLGHGPRAAALSLARARSRRQGPRRSCHGPAAGGQARHRLRAGDLRPHRRCAGAEGQHRAARHPLGAGDRLWPAAHGLRRVRRAARRAVRQGAAARGAHRRAAHLRASARAQPALPSRPADRCAGPRDRPRLAGHPVGAAARGVQRGADGDRAAAGHRDHLAPVRLALRRDHLRRGGELRRLHHELRHLALAHPPHDERHRQRCQHEGARQPAELRDGEVFRQRAARGCALRRGAGTLRARRGAGAGVAQSAEHRPGVHHRRGADADHADGRRARCAAAR